MKKKKVENKGITLPWANKIRDRLKEYVERKDKDLLAVMYFIEPIMKYAEAEEERITKEMAARYEKIKSGDYGL